MWSTTSDDPVPLQIETRARDQDPLQTEPVGASHHAASYNPVAAELAMPGSDQPPLGGEASPLLDAQGSSRPAADADLTDELDVLPGRPT